jgi:hypothetical protein
MAFALLEHTIELQGYFEAETSTGCVLLGILHKTMQIHRVLSTNPYPGASLPPKMHDQFFHIFIFSSIIDSSAPSNMSPQYSDKSQMSVEMSVEVLISLAPSR